MQLPPNITRSQSDLNWFILAFLVCLLIALSKEPETSGKLKSVGSDQGSKQQVLLSEH